MQCPNWETRKVMEIKLDPIETDGSCKSDDWGGNYNNGNCNEAIPNGVFTYFLAH
jgi:hypothetical protein